MKIFSVNSFNNRAFQPFKIQNSLPAGVLPVQSYAQSAYNPAYYGSNYYLSFCGSPRVDKGLERFYNTNKDIMPDTMRAYIEGLSPEEKEGLTPLEAQRRAFEDLLIAENVDDVKELFPDEPLFENLKPLSKTDAKRGFLYDARIMLPDLEAENSSVLNNKEDLTVYLLKKAYLENASLDEMNEALDKDLNPVFKNENGKYLAYSTLPALGIRFPKKKEGYLTSLRYTKDGYSDEVGAEISKSLIASWEALSDKEKAERGAKAAEKLEAYHAGLSDEEKAKLAEKRSIARAKKWASLTPEEKTELVEKMQTGSEKQKFAMINAWNNCDRIREHLSEYMSENGLHGNGNFIYREEDFSESQRRIMTAFWAKYPEDAELLGDEIRKSYEKIRLAAEDGVFEDLKAEISARQSEIKELNKAKNKNRAKNRKDAKKKTAASDTESTRKSDGTTGAETAKASSKQDPYIRFEKAFSTANPLLPAAFNKLYCDFVRENIQDKKAVEIWAKSFEGSEETSAEEFEYARNIITEIDDSPRMFRAKRAVEQAITEVLYEATDKSSTAKQLFGYEFVQLSHLLRLASSVDHPQNFNFLVDGGRPLTFVKKPKYEDICKLYNQYDRPCKTDEKVRMAVNAYLASVGAMSSGSDAVIKKTGEKCINFAQNWGITFDKIFSSSGDPVIDRAKTSKFYTLMERYI